MSTWVPPTFCFGLDGGLWGAGTSQPAFTGGGKEEALSVTHTALVFCEVRNAAGSVL